MYEQTSPSRRPLARSRTEISSPATLIEICFATVYRLRGFIRQTVIALQRARFMDNTKPEEKVA